MDKIYIGDGVHNLDKNLARTRCSHCSLCGYSGSKRSHLKDSCERCSSIAGEGCVQKPIGFTCDFLSCDQVCFHHTLVHFFIENNTGRIVFIRLLIQILSRIFILSTTI